MDVKKWPSELRFLREGYGGGGEDGVLRSQMDSGLSRTRPESTAPPPEVRTGTLMCSAAQLQVLHDFYFITLNRVGYFSMRDPTRPGATMICEFAARPSWEYTSAGYRVNVRFNVISNEAGAFPIADDMWNALATDNDEGLTT